MTIFLVLFISILLSLSKSITLTLATSSYEISFQNCLQHHTQIYLQGLMFLLLLLAWSSCFELEIFILYVFISLLVILFIYVSLLVYLCRVQRYVVIRFRYAFVFPPVLTSKRVSVVAAFRALSLVPSPSIDKESRPIPRHRQRVASLSHPL